LSTDQLDDAGIEAAEHSRVAYWSKNRDFAGYAEEIDGRFEATKNLAYKKERQQGQRQKEQQEERRRRRQQKQMDFDEKANEAIRRAYAKKEATKGAQPAGPKLRVRRGTQTQAKKHPVPALRKASKGAAWEEQRPAIAPIDPEVCSARSNRSNRNTARSSIQSSARHSARGCKAEQKKRSSARKAMLERVPPHQRAVMMAPTGFDDSGKMRYRYMPDAKDCSSDWPIPGMQGKKQPIAMRPYGVDDCHPDDIEDLAQDILTNQEGEEEATRRRRSMVKRELSNVPEHQRKLMLSYPNYPWNNYPYQPDPETGISKWPIPGMQGKYTPIRESPYAEGGDSTTLRRWERAQDAWFDPTKTEKGMPSRTESMADFCSSQNQSWITRKNGR
jgi:hypothetical protein